MGVRGARGRGRVLAVSWLCVFVVGGCVLVWWSHWSEERKTRQCVEVREQVEALADLSVQMVYDLNPDLQIEIETSEDDFEGSWGFFSDRNNDPPGEIRWGSERWLTVTPVRETASLVDPIAAELLARGWQIGPSCSVAESNCIDLYKYNYFVTIVGFQDLDPGDDRSMLIKAGSGFFSTPDDLESCTGHSWEYYK